MLASVGFQAHVKIFISYHSTGTIPSNGYSATQVPIGCIGAASVTSSSKSSKLSCCSLLVCSDAGDVDVTADTGVTLLLPDVSEA